MRLFATGSGREGIVHVIGPELGLTQPGMTIVCGDSHTSTHGAFGALAFGIGTSEVEHVLATQTLPQALPKTMKIEFVGRAAARPDGEGHGARRRSDGSASPGGRGHVIEYAGAAIRALSMEGRMTICNMSIEAGARAGMIAPDDVTFAYLEGRPCAPAGAAWERGARRWRALRTDDGAAFDETVDDRRLGALAAGHLGDEPGDGRLGRRRRPRSGRLRRSRPARGGRAGAALHGSRAGDAARDVRIDKVFIGSCTNARIEDLRAAAQVVAGRRVADGVHAIVVPGSALVKRQAEEEGLDRGLSRPPASSGGGPAARCASA